MHFHLKHPCWCLSVRWRGQVVRALCAHVGHIFHWLPAAAPSSCLRLRGGFPFVIQHLSTYTWQLNTCLLAHVLFTKPHEWYIMKEIKRRWHPYARSCISMRSWCSSLSFGEAGSTPVPDSPWLCKAQIRGPWLGCKGRESCLIIWQLRGSRRPQSSPGKLALCGKLSISLSASWDVRSSVLVMIL